MARLNFNIICKTTENSLFNFVFLFRYRNKGGGQKKKEKVFCVSENELDWVESICESTKGSTICVVGDALKFVLSWGGWQF